MRHQYGIKKLNRHGGHRRALLRNLATALFRHERIETTLVKAKALRRYAERLITLGKRGDLHARRLAAQEVHDHGVLQKLFDDVGPRFSSRAGGYTRVLKTGFRRGDNAQVALIELVDYKPQAANDETAPAKKAEKPEAKPKDEAKAKAKDEAKAKAKAERAEAKKAKADTKSAKKAEPKAEKKAKKAPAKKKATKK
jgi:large subunit ribosomal protein L17